MAASGLLATALLFAACGNDNAVVNPADRLCGGEAALALSLTSGKASTELCANNAGVAASLTPEDRYDIRAPYTSGTTRYDVRIEIPNRTDAPVVLGVTSDPAAAASDPSLVWLLLEEYPASGDTLFSQSVTSGILTLSFSDGTVAAGTLGGISMVMQNRRTGGLEGSRQIDTGFFSIQASP